MSEQYYTKKGRRYIPVGYQWEGFPADGIWLVHRRPYHKSDRWITRIGDVPSLFPFAQMQVSQEDISRVLANRMTEKAYSPSDLADEVIKWLAMDHDAIS